ncbi:MAG: hypothetical protein Q4A83_05970 [Bacillota bacterium]|nr:hypothetical protein [Bacillota bacterium]
MYSLNKVQKWAKAFKIICVVLFVCCVVAATFLAVVAIFGSAVAGTLISTGNVEIIGLIDDMNIDMAAMQVEALCQTVSSAFAAVFFAFAVKYLKDELRMGTPFTVEFSKKMRILAILSLALPAASEMIVVIIGTLMKTDTSFDFTFSVDIFLALILFALSAVLRYGSDLEGYGKDYSYYAKD